MAAVSNWTFRGTSLNTGNVKITELGNFTSLPPLRGDDFLTMGRTGRQHVPKLHDSRHIMLKIELLDVPDNSVQALLDQYAALFANRAQGALVYTDSAAATRTGQAEVVSWSPVHGDMAKVWTGVVDFLLADPWMVGTIVTGTVTPNAGLAFGTPVTSNISGPRTTWAAALTGVISGQPIIVVHATQGYTTALTSIADTFGGHYTWTQVDIAHTY